MKIINREKRFSVSLLMNVLIVLLFVTTGSSAFAQAFGGKTGTNNDTYIINRDNSNHRAALRLQDPNSAWILEHGTDALTFNWANNTDHNNYGLFRMSLDSGGDMRLWGQLEAKSIKLTGDFTFFEASVPTGSFNAIRGFNGSQTVARLHFFDDTWNTGNIGRSSGCVNIDGIKGVTLGDWNNPIIMMDKQSGNVGIGEKPKANVRLAVDGKIETRSVEIHNVGWADFVFNDDYKLPTLEEVEQHIEEKGHLKDIPSAKEVEENGIFVGEMHSKLLQKIEELTLYLIDQNKRLKVLEQENTILKEKINEQ